MEKFQEELKEKGNTPRDENWHLRIGFEGCKRVECTATRGQRAFQIILKEKKKERKKPEPRRSGRGFYGGHGEKLPTSDVAAGGDTVRPWKMG